MGRTAGPRLQSKSGPPAVLRRDAGESLPRLRLVVGDVRPCSIEPAAAVEEGLPHLLTRWAVKSRTPSPPCEGAACARTMSSAASTVYSERHPLDVSSSMQIDPPTVTWPVWKAKRGATTRKKGGEEGKSAPKDTSSSTVARTCTARFREGSEQVPWMRRLRRRPHVERGGVSLDLVPQRAAGRHAHLDPPAQHVGLVGQGDGQLRKALRLEPTRS